MTKEYTPCGARLKGAAGAAGKRCGKRPVSGNLRCELHGGLSTGPKSAAGKAAQQAAAQAGQKRWRDSPEGKAWNWHEARKRGAARRREKLVAMLGQGTLAERVDRIAQIEAIDRGERPPAPVGKAPPKERTRALIDAAREALPEFHRAAKV